MNWELFGLAAAAITASGFVPQIVKGYKTKHLKDLSYMMNALLLAGMSMWLVYGINKKDTAIIAANIVGVAFNLTLIIMKYYYGRNAAVADAAGKSRQPNL